MSNSDSSSNFTSALCIQSIKGLNYSLFVPVNCVTKANRFTFLDNVHINLFTRGASSSFQAQEGALRECEHTAHAHNGIFPSRRMHRTMYCRRGGCAADARRTYTAMYGWLCAALRCDWCQLILIRFRVVFEREG